MELVFGPIIGWTFQYISVKTVTNMLRFQTSLRFILQAAFAVKKAYYIIITIIGVYVWPHGAAAVAASQK